MNPLFIPAVGRRSRRSLLGILSAVALIALFVVPAQAVHDLGEFELDKNATDDLTTTHIGVLSSSISNSQTSFVVCQLVNQVGQTNFTIQIGAEQMTVASVTGTGTSTGGCPSGTINKRTYTGVVRGVNGTTAAAHAATEGDVTLIVTGAVPGDDWDQVFAQVSADPNDEGDDDKCIALGAVECAFVADGQGESIFIGGGSKDDLDIPNWQHTDGSVPDADEILDAYAAKYVSGVDQILYFGADRYATNGAKDFGFWFFKNPVVAEPDGTFSGTHSGTLAVPGDILILGTFTQGGAQTTIRVFRWVGTGGSHNDTLDFDAGFGDCVAAGSNDDGCGTVNDTSIPSPWVYQGKGTSTGGFIPSGGFVEGGVNLTNLGIAGCFSAFMAETRSSPEVGAQLKDFVLGQFEACESGLTTTPADGDGNVMTDSGEGTSLPDVSIGTGSVSVKDRAEITVTGTTTWSGTLSFFLCGPIADPDTCDDPTGVEIDSDVPVNQDTVQPIVSSAATITEVGRYCWRGFFDSATAGVDDATDSSLTECFEVLPVTPTLDTQAVDATGAPQTEPVPFGDPVFDKATLSGAANGPGDDGPGDVNGDYTSINATNGAAAGGTITFTLFGPDGATTDCTTVATSDDPTELNPQDVTVSGNGDYFSAGFTPDTPGVYHWVAEYSGDSPNTNPTDHNTDCTDADENVTVEQIPTAISTSQFFYPNDSATVSTDDGSDLPSGGQVVFSAYAGNDDATVLANCQAGGATGLLFSETQPISGTSPQSVSTTNTTDAVPPGTIIYWNVQYTSGTSAVEDRNSICVETTTLNITDDPGPGTAPA